MSTDKYPTASAVLPLKHVLLYQLSKAAAPADPPAVTEMREKITTDLEKRYGEEKGAFDLLNKASYLDPRFHRLVHLSAAKKTEVRTAIEEELIRTGDAGGPR